MTKTEFLTHIDDLLELPAGTLKGDENLDALDSWDSLAAVGFLGVVDKHFGISISPEQVEGCATVNDLISLAGEKVE